MKGNEVRITSDSRPPLPPPSGCQGHPSRPPLSAQSLSSIGSRLSASSTEWVNIGASQWVKRTVFTPKVNTQTHFRRSSYTELEPRRAEVWPCLFHTSYVSFTKSTKRTLMSRRPGRNTQLKSLAIYSIMSIFYGLLYTDRYHIFIICYWT